jgi:hypothetical protein
LLEKLHYYGNQGTTTDWFTSYLTKKKKSFEKSSSKLGRVKHGVPQWSILGPLLFIIYINDLPPTKNTLSEPILFADDSSVITSSKNFDDSSTISIRVFSLSLSE